MSVKTTNLLRRVSTAVLILVLVGDILLWMMFHATGHQIPIGTDVSFAMTIVIVSVLIYLAQKYIRGKTDNPL